MFIRLMEILTAVTIKILDIIYYFRTVFGERQDEKAKKEIIIYEKNLEKKIKDKKIDELNSDIGWKP